MSNVSVPRYREGKEGVTSAKHEAQAQILDMLHTWQSDLNLSQSHWEGKVRNKDENERRIKTKDIDSGRDSNLQPGKWPAMLNQLTYQVTRQLSAWVCVCKGYCFPKRLAEPVEHLTHHSNYIEQRSREVKSVKYYPNSQRGWELEHCDVFPPWGIRVIFETFHLEGSWLVDKDTSNSLCRNGDMDLAVF